MILMKEWIAQITDEYNDLWHIDAMADTREEIIKIGREIAKKDNLNKFRIGKIEKHEPYIYIDDIIENLESQLYDEIGDPDGFICGLLTEEKDELEEKINNLFFSYLKEKDRLSDLFKVLDDEWIEV